MKRQSQRIATREEEVGMIDFTGIEQQALLPVITDPKLFVVKCRVCFFFFCYALY